MESITLSDDKGAYLEGGKKKGKKQIVVLQIRTDIFWNLDTVCMCQKKTLGGNIFALT